jgi:phage baseplate assembly protein W
MGTKQRRILGQGLALPFTRGGQDFEVASGVEAVETALRMIMGTRCAGPTTGGEIPFNQELGNLLEFVRHRNLDDPTTQALADYYTVDAIRRNEPRILIKSVSYRRDRETMKLTIALRYDVIETNNLRNRVIARDVLQEVTI